MAAPTTLKDLASARLTAWQSRLADARGASVAAQAVLDQAVATLQKVTGELATATKDAADIRAELAEIATSADAEPLLADLDEATIAQRAAQAAILAAERERALARARLERATLAVREAEAGQREAQAADKAADLGAKRVAALAAALGQSPLNTLQADATALLGSTIATDAKTAVEKDLPVKLLERARERVAIARERIANRADSRDAFAALIAAQVGAKGGTEDKLTAPRADYAAALARLEDHVALAGQRFERANADLTRLADPLQKLVLTEQQKTRLNDSTLSAGREAAAGAEKALDEARRDREKAELELALEQAKEKAGASADVAGKQSALTTAQTAETTASGSYDAPARETLSLWEAAVPDEIWADLAAYDLACDTTDGALTRLAATDPANLSAVVTAAEAALVSALLALDAERAATAVYAAALATRTDASDFDSATAERIAFAALRGDTD